MPYKRFSREKLKLTDELALDRTVLANERTLLAYVRTTIMLGVSAVSLIKLFPENRFAIWAGLAMVPLALVVALQGLFRYAKLSRSLLGLRTKK